MTGWEIPPANWRKSTHSGEHGGDCVEIADAWRKSSHSADHGGDCIEVGKAVSARAVAVRDSKDPDGPVLVVSSSAFGVLIGAIKLGG
ncbi:DUF397 domain-containing protein [Spirillospora sp. CA-294931]|uniref:DUF397 domain-containing protein n=1 Tax=Spirillospora sp. CA-294931 TaxID=3240042 RepID=UPI003D8F9CE2